MTTPRNQCTHPVLAFGSGDYYIFCHECNGRWIAHNGVQSEYGFDKHGRSIGGCPEICNTSLSGQERVVPTVGPHHD